MKKAWPEIVNTVFSFVLPEKKEVSFDGDGLNERGNICGKTRGY
jgi:hypothetical protein